MCTCLSSVGQAFTFQSSAGGNNLICNIIPQFKVLLRVPTLSTYLSHSSPSTRKSTRPSSAPSTMPTWNSSSSNYFMWRWSSAVVFQIAVTEWQPIQVGRQKVSSKSETDICNFVSSWIQILVAFVVLMTCISFPCFLLCVRCRSHKEKVSDQGPVWVRKEAQIKNDILGLKMASSL